MAESRTLYDIFKKTAPLVTGIHREIFDSASNITVKINREQRMAEVGCFLPHLWSEPQHRLQSRCCLQDLRRLLRA